jgi:hypothetical protein
MKGRWVYVVAIALSLVLFAVSSVMRFVIQAGRITDIWSWGFPFAFYEAWGPCPAPGTCQALNPLLLMLDTLVWVAVGVGVALLVQGLTSR